MLIRSGPLEAMLFVALEVAWRSPLQRVPFWCREMLLVRIEDSSWSFTKARIFIFISRILEDSRWFLTEIHLVWFRIEDSNWWIFKLLRDVGIVRSVVAFKKEFPLDRLLWQVFFDLVHRPEELNDLWIVDHLQAFRLFAFLLLTIHFWATFIGTYGEWLH